MIIPFIIINFSIIIIIIIVFIIIIVITVIIMIIIIPLYGSFVIPWTVQHQSTMSFQEEWERKKEERHRKRIEMDGGGTK